MPKRNTIFNYIKDHGGGWCPFQGNMKIMKNDILKASLFCEEELIEVRVVRHLRFNEFYCIPTDSVYLQESDLYLVDKSIIDEILIDNEYLARRYKKKTDRYVAKKPSKRNNTT